VKETVCPPFSAALSPKPFFLRLFQSFRFPRPFVRERNCLRIACEPRSYNVPALLFNGVLSPGFPEGPHHMDIVECFRADLPSLPPILLFLDFFLLSLLHLWVSFLPRTLRDSLFLFPFKSPYVLSSSCAVFPACGHGSPTGVTSVSPTLSFCRSPDRHISDFDFRHRDGACGPCGVPCLKQMGFAFSSPPLSCFFALLATGLTKTVNAVLVLR